MKLNSFTVRVVACLFAGLVAGPIGRAADQTTLKDAFKNDFRVGFAINRKTGARTNVWLAEDLLDDLDPTDSVTSVYWN